MSQSYWSASCSSIDGGSLSSGGIIFASLPDLDWVFIHAQEIFHFQVPFYRQPHLHNLLGRIFNELPPFTLLNRLPNYRHNPWAILPEVALVAVLAVALRFRNRQSQHDQAARELG